MRKQKKFIEWLLYYPLIFSAWRSGGGGGSWNVYSYTTRRCFFFIFFLFPAEYCILFYLWQWSGTFFFFYMFFDDMDGFATGKV